MASGKGSGSMSLSMKFIRFLIVLFNLAFIVIGITLLIIGIFMVRDPKIQQLRPLFNSGVISKQPQNLSTIEVFAIVIIVIGGILLFIGFLGCCGAIKGFRFLHVIYATIIGAIILAEIGIVVYYFIFQSRFKSEFVGELKDSIAKHYVGTPINNSTSTNPISLSWDFLQFNLQCCGAANKNDYSNANHWNRINPYDPNTNLTVPLTCCPLNATKSWIELPKNMYEASTCATTGFNAYSEGCYDRLVDLLASYKTYIIIGIVVVVVIEILAFLFAIMLYCRKKDYYDV